MIDRPPIVDAVVLIGGTGRSGTTVLKRALGRHPDLASLPMESRILVDPDGLADFVSANDTNWSPFNYDRRIVRLGRMLRDASMRGRLARIGDPLADLPKDLQASTRGSEKRARRIVRKGRGALRSNSLRPRYFNLGLSEWYPGYDSAVAELLANLTAFSYCGRWNGMQRFEPARVRFGPPADIDVAKTCGRFYLQCAQGIAAVQSAKMLVEDSPLNHLAFATVVSMIPGARLIHIHRDPRDVVCSMLTKRWAPSDPVQAAQWYRAVYEKWLEVRAKLPAASYWEVSLEAIVRDPRRMLGRAQQFAGLAPSDRVLEESFLRANTGRWKMELDAEAQRSVLSIVGPAITGFDYQR